MRNHGVDHVPGRERIEIFGNAFFLRLPAGKARFVPARLRASDRRYRKLHRFAHPADQGDIPNFPFGDADGALFPGDHALHTAEADVQIVFAVALHRPRLQHGSLQHGVPERGDSSQRRAVLRPPKKRPFGIKHTHMLTFLYKNIDLVIK